MYYNTIVNSNGSPWKDFLESLTTFCCLVVDRFGTKIRFEPKTFKVSHFNSAVSGLQNTQLCH